MTSTQTTPVTAVSTGFVRLRRSLNLRMRPTEALPAGAEPSWTPDFVAEARDESPVRLSMTDFGYRPFELTGFNTGNDDDLAYSGVHQVLTSDGVAAFRTVCEQLAYQVPDDDYIVSTRLRNTDNLSRFVHTMMRDRRFLRRLSLIAGVPLVPHPISDAGVCINYFEGPHERPTTDESPKVAKWHYDGMTYVFVMQLTDSSDFDGGQLMIYQNHQRQFEHDRQQVIAAGSDHPDVFLAPFDKAGDTVFTRGSRLWHAVRPVTAGKRISVVLSLYSPVTACDENEFWHVAAEDGLPQAIRNFRHLRHAQHDPLDYCRRNGVNLADFLTAPTSEAG
jgi:hypothetical protein